MSAAEAADAAVPAKDQARLVWSAPFAGLAVGQRFEGSARTVEESDVMAFCGLTGDWHPQHSDREWAAGSPFGEQIAHGMLVLSLAVGLVPLDPARVCALRRIGDAVFKRPLRFGEQMSVAGEIASLRRVDESAGLVDLRLSIRGGEGALVCRASVQVLWIDGDVEPYHAPARPHQAPALPYEAPALPYEAPALHDEAPAG